MLGIEKKMLSCHFLMDYDWELPMGLRKHSWLSHNLFRPLSSAMADETQISLGDSAIQRKGCGLTSIVAKRAHIGWVSGRKVFGWYHTQNLWLREFSSTKYVLHFKKEISWVFPSLLSWIEEMCSYCIFKINSVYAGEWD